MYYLFFNINNFVFSIIFVFFWDRGGDWSENGWKLDMVPESNIKCSLQLLFKSFCWFLLDINLGS